MKPSTRFLPTHTLYQMYTEHTTTWACDKCTFKNSISVVSCEICNDAKREPDYRFGVYVDKEDELVALLRVLRMAATNVPADGDCFFSSMVILAPEHPLVESVKESRHNALCQIKAYRDVYSEGFPGGYSAMKKQCKRMTKTGEWDHELGDILPRVFSDFLNCDINVYTWVSEGEGTMTLRCHRHTPIPDQIPAFACDFKSPGTLRLLHVGIHYMPLASTSP